VSSGGGDRDPRRALLRARVRDVPDFPKPGILFRDLTPLMGDGAALREAIDMLAEAAVRHRPELIVAIESRGFIFGAPVAASLGVGFVPVRKPGKLPHKTRRRSYDLEYGTDALEMHADAVVQGARVVIVDDLLATGGTAGATVELVREIGGEVVGATFVVELELLRGRDRLADVPVDALLTY
jgi:adenine phosphoribosyltransferase